MKQNITKHKDPGMIKIFKEPTEFHSSIYQEITDVPDEKYEEYYHNFYNIYFKINDIFPGLHVNKFPYFNCKKTITLTGILITRKIIKEFLLTEEYEFLKYGLKVFIVVPLDFIETGIKVFDYYNVIDFSVIPHQYLHFRNTSLKNRVICTHHKDYISPTNPIISVLYSAWSLFVEYKKLEKTGRFDLICLPHNYRGTTRNI